MKTWEWKDLTKGFTYTYVYGFQCNVYKNKTYKYKINNKILVYYVNYTVYEYILRNGVQSFRK